MTYSGARCRHREAVAETAAHVLFDRHHGYVYSSVVALKSAYSSSFATWRHYLDAVAEDVVPFAFVVAINKFDDTKNTAFRSWWVHVSLLQFQNEARAHRKRPRPRAGADLGSTLELSDHTSEMDLDEQLLRDEIRTIVLRMDPLTKDVFLNVIHPIDDVAPLTTDEYAAQHRIPPHRVKYLRRRARQEFLAIWNRRLTKAV